MIVTKHVAERLYITDIYDLDPIDVYIENFKAGQGRVTLQCYGDAWTAYFGAMSGKTIQEFIAGCGADYLVNKFLGQHHKRSKSHEKYLMRIIDTVKAALVTQ